MRGRYYAARAIDSDSPVALLLHFVLSTYHAIQAFLALEQARQPVTGPAAGGRDSAIAVRDQVLPIAKQEQPEPEQLVGGRAYEQVNSSSDAMARERQTERCAALTATMMAVRDGDGDGDGGGGGGIGERDGAGIRAPPPITAAAAAAARAAAGAGGALPGSGE
eukprot:SAG25_NODE_1637_length_2642_cov_3.620134_5_plen_163_part_01